MPDIPGRMKYEGYISPAPPKGAPKEVRVFMARTYAGLRKEKYPGEIKENKQRAAKITWYQTRRKFGRKYLEIFRKTRSRDPPAPAGLEGKESQIERGARMEYREHPELGREAARKIAIDHIRKDPAEYTTGNKYLKPVSVRPSSTVKGRKAQVRDLHSAAREQRRWAATARNEQVSELQRARRIRKTGSPVTARDLEHDAKVAGAFSKERKAVADNYDLQAKRIEAMGSD